VLFCGKALLFFLVVQELLGREVVLLLLMLLQKGVVEEYILAHGARWAVVENLFEDKDLSVRRIGVADGLRVLSSKDARRLSQFGMGPGTPKMVMEFIFVGVNNHADEADELALVEPVVLVSTQGLQGTPSPVLAVTVAKVAAPDLKLFNFFYRLDCGLFSVDDA